MTFWLACARSLHIASSILLAAAFLFRLIVLRPAAARSGSPETFYPRHKGAWNRLAVASWITVIVSGIAWSGAVTASIAGEDSLLNVSPEIFVTVLLQTQFGHLWLARSGCCLVLGVLLLINCRESVIAFFSLAILASLAVAGHAAATASSASMLALVGDMGHLVAAAVVFS
jgi:putative copper export protein